MMAAQWTNVDSKRMEVVAATQARSGRVTTRSRRQVRICTQAVAGVRGDDEAAPELAEQRLLAHHAQHPLAVDGPASPLRRVGHGPVAVAGE